MEYIENYNETKTFHNPISPFSLQNISTFEINPSLCADFTYLRSM